MDDEAEIGRIEREAGALWDAGHFFACHDKLEEAWQRVKHEKKAEAAKDPRRDLVHGIILCAAAYVHWERGNALGVERKLDHARQAFARTPARTVGGADFTRWIPEVAAHLEQGARGTAFVAGAVPRWPVRRS